MKQLIEQDFDQSLCIAICTRNMLLSISQNNCRKEIIQPDITRKEIFLSINFQELKIKKKNYKKITVLKLFSYSLKYK